MKLTLTIAAATALVAAAACGEASTYLEPQATINAAKGAPGGGAGGGGGGVTTPPVTPPTTPVPAPSGGGQIPPSPQTDGPAWFFAELGSILGPNTADVDFDAMQNLSAGGISVGTSRTATELVFNVSKKTTLTITNIAFVGANPGDFSVAPADIAAAATTVLAANKGAVEQLHVSFIPTAPGLRTATLLVTSAAGVAEIQLRGTGLPQRPMLAQMDGSLDFLPASAPATFMVQNIGGETLSLNSFTIEGANPEAFVLTSTQPFSNCFAGVLLAPKALCRVSVGVAAGATPPATAVLIFRTNDPVTPQVNVTLNLLR